MNSNTIKENIHHGRYNEPGANGKDIYQISKKAADHMKQIKKNEKHAAC